MTCQECKERMHPRDPSKPFYVGFQTGMRGVSPVSGSLPPLCNSCSNFPGIWRDRKQEQPEPAMPVRGLSRVKADELEQLQGRVNWLQGKLEEHLKRKPKGTYTIK